MPIKLLLFSNLPKYIKHRFLAYLWYYPISIHSIFRWDVSEDAAGIGKEEGLNTGRRLWAELGAAAQHEPTHSAKQGLTVSRLLTLSAGAQLSWDLHPAVWELCPVQIEGLFRVSEWGLPVWALHRQQDGAPCVAPLGRAGAAPVTREGSTDSDHQFL